MIEVLEQMNIDNAIAAVLMTIATGIAMRLLYGYWPWQINPERHKTLMALARQQEQGGFDFEPITASPLLGVANENGGAHVRASGGEPEATSSPKGTTPAEENS